CLEPTCCRFSPDGRWLAAGGGKGALWVWDLNDFEAFTCQAADNTHANDDTYVNELEFSPDGKLLATGMYNGVVKLWTVSPLQEIQRLYSPAAEAAGPMAVSALAFSSDG